MYDLTGFQRDILYCIARGDGASGMEVADAVSEYRDKEYHLSQVYKRLQELSDDGFIRIETQSGSTKSYRLTRRARVELKMAEDWKTEMVDNLSERLPA